jgi:hypothetical protein
MVDLPSQLHQVQTPPVLSCGCPWSALSPGTANQEGHTTVLILLVLLPIAGMLVARWAWRYQLQALGVACAALANLPDPTVAAREEVELLSVLPDDSRVLVGYQRTGAGDQPNQHSSVVLLSLGADEQAVIARLQRWRASRAPLLLGWEGGGTQVEFYQSGSGRQVCLTVASDGPG